MRDYAEVRADGVVDARRSPASRSSCSRSTSSASTRSTAPSCAALCETFAGQPVGLHTLAVAVAEEPETVEEVYEPFLLKAGLLQRTPRGRVATPGAYAHLHLPAPRVVPSLFATDD